MACKEDIEKVNSSFSSRTDFENFLLDMGGKRDSAGKFFCMNPAHRDKHTGSVTIYFNQKHHKWCFKCFSCGFHADATEIVKASLGINSRIEAAKYLSQKKSIALFPVDQDSCDTIFFPLSWEELSILGLSGDRQCISRYHIVSSCYAREHDMVISGNTYRVGKPVRPVYEEDGYSLVATTTELSIYSEWEENPSEVLEIMQEKVKEQLARTFSLLDRFWYLKHSSDGGYVYYDAQRKLLTLEKIVKKLLCAQHKVKVKEKEMAKKVAISKLPFYSLPQKLA